MVLPDLSKLLAAHKDQLSADGNHLLDDSSQEDQVESLVGPLASLFTPGAFTATTVGLGTSGYGIDAPEIADGYLGTFSDKVPGKQHGIAVHSKDSSLVSCPHYPKELLQTMGPLRCVHRGDSYSGGWGYSNGSTDAVAFSYTSGPDEILVVGVGCIPDSSKEFVRTVMIGEGKSSAVTPDKALAHSGQQACAKADKSYADKLVCFF